MSTTTQPSDTSVETAATSTPKPVPLVMQIIVRRDLLAVRLRRRITLPLFTTIS